MVLFYSIGINKKISIKIPLTHLYRVRGYVLKNLYNCAIICIEPMPDLQPYTKK